VDKRIFFLQYSSQKKKKKAHILIVVGHGIKSAGQKYKTYTFNINLYVYILYII
jgi:hypothetical protein